MANKENLKTEERPIQAQAHRPPPCDTDDVLRTLNQVFSKFRNRLDDEAPPPFDGNAKVAVDAFNDILAGLRFKFVPHALQLAGRPLSPTEIELTWSDQTHNADGYRIQRCQGQNCSDFLEIRQLSPNARSFREANLTPYATYRYQLVAFNTRGATPSNIVTVTPSPIHPAST